MHRDNFGAKHLNTENVEGLSSDILGTHIDDTFHTKTSTDSCSCYTMLTSTSLGDNTFLAYPACKEDLRKL